MWLGWTRKCHLDYILPFFLSERTIHPSRWQKGRLWRAITGRYYAALHNLIPPRAPPDHKYIPLAIDCYLSPIFYRGNYRVPLARGNRRCARRAAYKGAMSDIRVKVNDSCGKRRFNVKMTPLEGNVFAYRMNTTFATRLQLHPSLLLPKYLRKRGGVIAHTYFWKLDISF